MAAIAVPHHKLYESPNTRSIDVHGWRITACTNPISSAVECDALQAELGLPLPEMIFGNNSLVIHHQSSKWQYSFDALNALKAVRNGELQEGDGGVKVGYADAWLKSRTDPTSSLPMPETVATKPYDWTYTTTYLGHSDDSSSSTSTTNSRSWKPADRSNVKHAIPMAELTRPDPILFYAEIPLFEDELHDNGASSVLVRIRVMPTCIFILSRFILRVDHVLFRMQDTRLYHSYASSPPLLVRETSGWEAPYDIVKEQLPRRDDLTPLTDPAFIGKILSTGPPEITQATGAGTGWRGLGTKMEVLSLL